MSGSRWRVALIVLLIFGLLLYYLGSVLLPFIAGILVAYFLDPVVDRMERAGLSRTLATTLVTVLFFAIVGVAIAFAIPALHHQIVGLMDVAPRTIERLRDIAAPWIERFAADYADEAMLTRLRDAAGGMARNILGWATQVLASIWSGGLALLNLLSLIIITPVVAFYLLRDYDKFLHEIDHMLPRREAPTIRKLAGDMDAVLAGFIRGQATVCLTLAVYYAVALSVAGLHFGMVVGLVTGALAFIPYVGALTGFSLALGIGLAQYGIDVKSLLLVAAIFGIGQVLEGFFLTPRLVGEKVGLHPVWVMFALLAGGAVFGFVGVLVALPVAAVAAVLIRHSIQRYKSSTFYGGGDG